MREILEVALKALDENKPSALIILTKAKGSTPRKPGAMMLIFKDGKQIGTVGGGVVESKLKMEALKAIAEEKVISIHFELTEKSKDNLGLYCGGEIEFSIIPLLPQEKLIIFGGGHVSKALVPLASKIGFKVIVVDDREEYAKEELFEGAHRVVLSDYAEFAKKIKGDKHTYILIATQTHDSDFKILKIMLDRSVKYLGMLGSKTKILTFKKRLDDKLKKKLEKLKTPVGLDIGAETPNEIAISILAELIKVRRMG